MAEATIDERRRYIHLPGVLSEADRAELWPSRPEDMPALKLLERAPAVVTEPVREHWPTVRRWLPAVPEDMAGVFRTLMGSDRDMDTHARLSEWHAGGCTLLVAYGGEFEGGEIQIGGGMRSATVPVRPGSLLLYDARRTHRVLPVTKGQWRSWQYIVLDPANESFAGRDVYAAIAAP